MSTPIPDCGVCLTRHISKVSSIWCSECGEGLCLDCREHHGASKSTRHHVTVPIKEYRKLPVFILKIKEICEKHNEKYQMFCKSHGCPCCRNCTIENHKECKDVIIIEDIIQDAKKSVSFDDVRQTKLSFQADDQKLNLLNNVNRFGKIIIERKSSEAYKQNQAQQRVVSIPVRSVNDVMLKLKQRIKSSCSFIVGCCILFNGKKVFINYFPREVIILHKDGSRDYIINIRSGNPYYVTCIDSNSMAVSVVGGDNQIRIIDLDKRSITKQINTKSNVHGITYNDGSLICCAQDRGLIRIDLKDNSITPAVRCSLPAWSCVTTNGNNIYYTNGTTHKVTCCDMSGKVQWEFYDENVLNVPRGITTDNNNNIFVVGAGSNNVVVISSDGQSHKVLISHRDGVKLPREMHCDRASNQLLLTNDGENTGVLYDISTTPT